MTTLSEWCQRWQVPYQAERELRALMGVIPAPEVKPGSGESEAMVQSKVRLKAAQQGAALFRNNVGVLVDDTGRPVRYGLANDSSKVNKKIKSGDLIGVRPITIAPEMVGKIIGQFMSLEVKPSGWVYTGTERERAQLKWAEIINSHGGYAKFITGEDQL